MTAIDDALALQRANEQYTARQVLSTGGTVFPVPATPAPAKSEALQAEETKAQYGFLSSLVNGITGAGAQVGSAALARQKQPKIRAPFSCGLIGGAIWAI